MERSPGTPYPEELPRERSSILGSLSKSALVLWAKSSEESGRVKSYHPLICHMIDVSKVTQELWKSVLSQAARDRTATALGLSQEDVTPWLSFWSGMHDIGKASPAFQLRLKDGGVKERLLVAELPCSSIVGATTHGVVTAICFKDILCTDFGFPETLASRIATIVAGHHGIFPGSTKIVNASSKDIGRGKWMDVRRELAEALAGLVGVPRVSVPQGGIGNATAMFLAGLVSVSDWIGSMEEHFPYASHGLPPPEDIDPMTYAAAAGNKARRALRNIGWVALSPQPPIAFSELFAYLSQGQFHVRPVQEKAAEIAQSVHGPCLTIVEVPMGEGKTEASMFLADRWGTVSGLNGYFFALPTQATSNQMFLRLKDFLEHRYPTGQPQLQLLHGHASMSAEFDVLRRNADRLLTPSGIHAEDGHPESSANVIASEWFTYRKRGLLAPIGVGTVDQSLLAVLQSRHFFVRLFGLAHKTIVVDEVHAYDTYMTRLLERLLEWLGALGTSVILLSATLPKSRTAALAASYARGLGAKQIALPYAPYPRVSWVSSDTASANEVQISPQSRKVIHLEGMYGGVSDTGSAVFGLGERLRAALKDGGCAAVILNTVRRAQEVYIALKPFFQESGDDGLPELGLLHAQYLFEDREYREKTVLTRFGKPGAEAAVSDGQVVRVRRPKRAVLVSTQIIEQSLDIDFDLMVSELAPVDLLLQRAGRLHRHNRQRPQGLGKPVLWLLMPDVSDDGVPSFDPGTRVVYDEHVLLRTWLQLSGRTTVTVPDDVEGLIEGVYDDTRRCPYGATEALHRRWEETKREHFRQVESDTYEAETRWLPPPDYDGPLWRFAFDPKEEDSPEFNQAHQALTRLSLPTAPVICLRGDPVHRTVEEPGLERLNLASAPTIEQTKTLLRRSLSISDKRIVHTLLAQDPPDAWQRSPLLRHHRLILVGEDFRTRVGGYWVRLDETIGLKIEVEGESGR